MQMQAVIDRFEGDKAVLLVGSEEAQVVWPRQLLPGEVKEGDILQVNLQIDSEATKTAKLAADNLLKEILAKNQEG